MVRLDLDLNQQRMLTQVVTGLPVLDPVLGPWVAGGAVRAAVVYQDLDEARDVDVFFASGGQVAKFESRLRELGYQPGLSDHNGVRNYVTQWRKVIQLVIGRKVASALELLSDFSITACQFVTDGHHVWAGEQAVEHARDRRFVINNPARLSEQFVTKYLADYGYTYDGDVDALVSMDFDQWYAEHESEAIPSGMDEYGSL